MYTQMIPHQQRILQDLFPYLKPIHLRAILNTPTSGWTAGVTYDLLTGCRCLLGVVDGMQANGEVLHEVRLPNQAPFWIEVTDAFDTLFTQWGAEPTVSFLHALARNSLQRWNENK